MTKDEALKLALVALETECGIQTFAGLTPTYKAYVAITAIKEALAQPEQDWKIHPKEDAPLVKWAKEQTPPQRTWVGLTDEDELDWDGGDLKSLVKAIEAKLRSKNT